MNDPVGDAEQHALLREFDSVHGRWRTPVAAGDGALVLNGQTITVSNIDQSNGFSYKQIERVVDTQDPTIENCPASPVTFCDLTPNDGQLWNESYWYDNGTMSHDLCEGPVDLSITATDACGGSVINIK